MTAHVLYYTLSLASSDNASTITWTAVEAGSPTCHGEWTEPLCLFRLILLISYPPDDWQPPLSSVQNPAVFRTGGDSVVLWPSPRLRRHHRLASFFQ